MLVSQRHSTPDICGISSPIQNKFATLESYLERAAKNWSGLLYFDRPVSLQRGMRTGVIQADGEGDEIIHNIPQMERGIKKDLFEC